MRYPKSYQVLIGILAVAVIFTAVGFAMVFKRSHSSNNPAPVQQSQNQPVLDWKVYKNDRVGYQFEYPTSGLILDLSEPTTFGTGANDSKSKDMVDFATKTNYSVVASLGALKDNATLESWIQNGVGMDKDLTHYNKTLLDGRTAYSHKDYNFVIIFYKANIYQIAATDGIQPQKDKNDPIFTHLISTFSFIPGSVPDVALKADDQKAPVAISIDASENTATPSVVSVPSWSIVQLTFAVNSKVPMEFKSSNITTSEILPGANKTISFIATQSFELIPYIAGVPRPYSIMIQVEQP